MSQVEVLVEQGIEAAAAGTGTEVLVEVRTSVEVLIERSAEVLIEHGPSEVIVELQPAEALTEVQTFTEVVEVGIQGPPGPPGDVAGTIDGGTFF